MFHKVRIRRAVPTECDRCSERGIVIVVIDSRVTMIGALVAVVESNPFGSTVLPRQRSGERSKQVAQDVGNYHVVVYRTQTTDNYHCPADSCSGKKQHLQVLTYRPMLLIKLQPPPVRLTLTVY